MRYHLSGCQSQPGSCKSWTVDTSNFFLKYHLLNNSCNKITQHMMESEVSRLLEFHLWAKSPSSWLFWLFQNISLVVYPNYISSDQISYFLELSEVIIRGHSSSYLLATGGHWTTESFVKWCWWMVDWTQTTWRQWPASKCCSVLTSFLSSLMKFSNNINLCSWCFHLPSWLPYILNTSSVHSSDIFWLSTCETKNNWRWLYCHYHGGPHVIHSNVITLQIDVEWTVL